MEGARETRQKREKRKTQIDSDEHAIKIGFASFVSSPRAFRWEFALIIRNSSPLRLVLI
jgi:hypothetical protein